MSGGKGEPSGPDLREGIASEALVEGGMLVGHVAGENVLLARVAGEVWATGASCTHYGGPLGDGVLEGDRVHCPWHHACFNVRTGAVAQPPALADLARWRVEEEGGSIRVLEKLPAAPDLQPVRGPVGAGVGPTSVVIVGGGAAGNAAAETLHREGYEGAIIMIEPDEGAPCDRPNLSKDYLAGTAPEDWIPLRPDSFYQERGIELVRDRRVAALDLAAQTVILDDGTRRDWGALLLATGAEPVRLPASVVAEGGRVHYLRTLSDSRAIIAAAAEAHSAVVVGASLIGLEVTASLRARGLPVTVVAPEDRPLGSTLGERLGDFVRRLHEEHGVIFRLGHTVRQVTRGGVVLDDGEKLPADLVVAGIGVRPRTSLAREAGIAVDNGILVDPFLATTAPGVFAAGDVASWPDPYTDKRIRVEHWVVAERQGQTAAWNILGLREPFRAAPFFWSQHYEATIAYVGHAAAWDEAAVDGTPEDLDCTVTYRSGDRVVAVATIFRDHKSLAAELEMERLARATTND